MNKQYTYIENQYPARPRSKRRRETGGGTSSGGNTTVVTGGGINDGGTGGVTSHSQLSGVISTDDEYSEFAKDIHLTAGDADALKRLSTLEIIESTDEETIPTDFNLYSALKAKLEDEKKVQEMENKFIRKDKPDETDYRVDFHDGITTGNYVGGLLGDGAIIDKGGNAEMTSLKLREFLEVPELRFNRVDVVSGELWNAIAFGLIEEVDEVNQIVKLKLEEGEQSGMHLSDFCRGIFHNLTDNETAPGIDGSGFDVMIGFRTSYFTPVDIIDNARFKYELKPGTTVHPCKSMKYAVYGNPVDKNRQASAYHTRTYTRYLRGVNTWKIESKHISLQLGDLSNLTIDGESLADGSVYLNNVYFGGNIWHTPGAFDSLKGNDAYSVTLSTYSAVYNIADGIYEQADVVSGDNKIVTGISQVVASQFNVSTRLQVSKGSEQLRFSEVLGTGKYLVTSTGTNCTYVITDGLVAVQEVTADKAEIKIEVNCEGVATYEVVFTIVRVADGKDGKDYEYIYTRTVEEKKPTVPATSQIDDYVPKDWTDDSVGPTLQLPFEWVCKRVKRDGVWGNYSVPSLWARFGEDGTDYEYIYTRTKTQSAPATPATSQSNDYVPSGWTDDPAGPTSEYSYEWVSKRTKVSGVWGVYSTPALWSKFAEDGSDHEFIYTRTTTYNTPSTPATSQVDDYVPKDWTDDPVGVTSTYIYEWMSKRDKVKGIWGAFSTPALWSKFATDGKPGTPGTNGRYTEDRYKRSDTQPSVSGNPPSGWSLDPPASESGPIWVIRATFNGDGSISGSWSTPVKWTGSDGKDGKDGAIGPQGTQGIPGTSQYFHVKYSVNSNGNPMVDTPNTYIGTSVTSSPTAPTSYTSYKWVQLKGSQGLRGEQGIAGTPGTDGRTPYLHIKYSDNGTSFTSNNGETPGAWIGQYVDFTAADSSVFSRYTWSKIKGEQGETGPAMTYRDLYDPNKTYVGNSARVDAVRYYYMNSYKYFAVLPTAGSFKGVVPSDTSKWRSIGDQYESIATGFAFIEEALIAGWRFKENHIESQNNNVVLDGNADSGPRIALGASYANRNSAPTRMYDDGRSVIKKGEIAGFTIENGWLKASAAPGTGVGYIAMETGNSNISFGEDLIPSQAGGAYTLTGLIENRKSNKGEPFGQENENIALKLSAKNATANWGLDCFGGIRKIGRGVEVNEPYIMAGKAMADLLETKIKYYNYFQLQPPEGYDVLIRLPAYTLLISELGGTLPNGTPLSLGITTITLSVQAGFKGRIVLVGVNNGRLVSNQGGLLDDYPISGYNYGTLGLTQCNIVKLGQFNGGWTPLYLSR